MCLETLGKILEIRTSDDGTPAVDGIAIVDRTAIVDIDGVARRVSLAVLDLEDTLVTPGDWILSHTGLAIRVVNESEARKLQDARNEIYASLLRTPLPERSAPLPGKHKLPPEEDQLRDDGEL